MEHRATTLATLGRPSTPIRSAAILALSTACSVGLDLPGDADIQCDNDRHCLEGEVCLASVGRCSPPEADCVRSTGAGFDIEIDGVGCGGSESICVGGLCAEPGCGDGVVTGLEQCDDGADNHDRVPDACRTDCMAAACGDGVVDTGESCDDGTGNSDVDTGACRTTCTSCGDGVTDAGEACDDGDDNDNDDCTNDCTTPFCGDGSVWNEGFGAEQCDEPPQTLCVYGDVACVVCTVACEHAAGITSLCSDGVVDAAHEQCDDGNINDADGCSAVCAAESNRDCRGAPSRCALILRVDGDNTSSIDNDGSTWEKAYLQVQDALDAARGLATPVDIWVAEGIYYPDQGSLGGHLNSNRRDETFALVDDTEIYGGFGGTETAREQRNPQSHTTTLHGDVFGDDAGSLNLDNNAFHVISGSALTHNVLDGLTVTAGAATDTGVLEDVGSLLLVRGHSDLRIHDCIFSAGRGLYSAVQLSFADTIITNSVFNDISTTPAVRVLLGSVTISDSAFRGNSFGALRVDGAEVRMDRVEVSDTEGAVGSVHLLSSTAVLNDSIFGNNRGPSALRVVASLVTVDGCDFQDTQGMVGNVSGGLVAVDSDVTVLGSRFTGNAGGLACQSGAIVAENTQLKVLGSFLHDNDGAGGGGIRLTNSDTILWSNLISGNDATDCDGGAVRIQLGRTLIVNNTIVHNRSDIRGGGISVASTAGEVTITNNVLWANWPTQIEESGGEVGAFISYNILEGALPNPDNNININPVFVDLDGPDDIIGTDDDDPTIDATSPCIDSGDNDALATSHTEDVMSQPRRADDPATSDTGNGTAPIVDRGAFELQP